MHEGAACAPEAVGDRDCRRDFRTAALATLLGGYARERRAKRVRVMRRWQLVRVAGFHSRLEATECIVVKRRRGAARDLDGLEHAEARVVFRVPLERDVAANESSLLLHEREGVGVVVILLPAAAQIENGRDV